MARVKRGVIAGRRHKKILAKAKGYYNARRKVFRTAKQAVIKAGQYAYRDRRAKKRDMRALWITRINAAVRENDRDFLLSIRNGAFQNEDGTYRPEFFELVSDYEKRLSYAKQNTSLPQSPDMKRIEEFVVTVNRRSLGD